MIMEILEEAKDYFRDCDRKKFDKIVWDMKDWEIFYECLGFAMYKILHRDRKKVSEIDYQI